MKILYGSGLCGKLYKTSIKHNLGYRPIMELMVKKIGESERFPLWIFHRDYILENSFYFYHEKYSKKEFKFFYTIYKSDQLITFETKSI